MISLVYLPFQRASPGIAEKAEEFETTYKLEINDEEPMKKKLKRIQFDVNNFGSTPKMKNSPNSRQLDIIISSPEPSPRRPKLEIPSPAPSPEPEPNSMPDIPSNAPATSMLKEEPCDYSIPVKLSPKNSPHHENLPPETVEIKEEFTSTIIDSYSQISSMSDTTRSSNSYNSGFIHPLDISSPYASNSNYPTPLPSCMSTSVDSSYLSTYTPSYHTPEPRMAEPLPILRISSSNSRHISPEEYPIKLPVLSKPIVLKAAPMQPPTEEQSSSDQERNEPIIKRDGRYELSNKMKELIDKDIQNKYWWDVCVEKYSSLGKQVSSDSKFNFQWCSSHLERIQI